MNHFVSAPMLEKINQLKPATYRFKNPADKGDHNGFSLFRILSIKSGTPMCTRLISAALA
jgi:hypothetical protein